MERTGSKRTKRNTEESELISLAQKKNERAFMEMYNRYKDGLRIHIAKIIPQWDVEDICMQTFLKAFMHIESYDPAKSEFRTWLYTIGWNTALDHVGKKKREQDNMPTTSIDEGMDSGASRLQAAENSPEEDISRKEDYDKLINYIDMLGDLYREIAKDRFLSDCEYEEIAEKHGLPLNTVKTRIKRAKEQLQKMMETSDEIM